MMVENGVGFGFFEAGNLVFKPRESSHGDGYFIPHRMGEPASNFARLPSSDWFVAANE